MIMYGIDQATLREVRTLVQRGLPLGTAMRMLKCVYTDRLMRSQGK